MVRVVVAAMLAPQVVRAAVAAAAVLRASRSVRFNSSQVVAVVVLVLRVGLRVTMVALVGAVVVRLGPPAPMDKIVAPPTAVAVAAVAVARKVGSVDLPTSMEKYLALAVAVAPMPP